MTFITGIETAADAPLPGEEPPRSGRRTRGSPDASTVARRSRALVLAVSSLALGSTTGAESALWTSWRPRWSQQSGSSAVFTLTATNEDPLAALKSSSEIGCVVVTSRQPSWKRGVGRLRLAPSTPGPCRLGS